MKKTRQQKNKAFTLIEMLVVVSIIGILIALGVTSYRVAQQKSRDAKRKADLEILRQALVIYRQDNGNYGNVSDFDVLVTSLYDHDYLTDSELVDPKNDETHQYSSTCILGTNPDCERVTLQATLESGEGESYEIRTP